MPHSLGSSPACSRAHSFHFFSISSWHRGQCHAIQQSSGPARATSSEEAHQALVQQNNVATVFCSGFSGLVTSSQTTNKEIRVGRATLVLSTFSPVVAKPSFLLITPFAPSSHHSLWAMKVHHCPVDSEGGVQGEWRAENDKLASPLSSSSVSLETYLQILTATHPMAV